MNCTRCGAPLEEAICGNCQTNHKELLYKLADDAQVRREYAEANDYMELIKRSTIDREELNNIDRTMAKLGFAQTDLTGNNLKIEKRRMSSLKILRVVFVVLIAISVMLISYNIYESSNNKSRFEIIEIK